MESVDGVGCERAGFGPCEFCGDAVFASADVVFVSLELVRPGAEPGKGVDETGASGWVVADFGFEGRAVDGSEEMIEVEAADFVDGFADVAVGRGLGDGDGVFTAGVEVVLKLLFADPVLIAALVPFGEVAVGELLDVVRPAMAMLVEFVHDAAVLRAVIEHAIYEFAQVFREAGDFAVTFVHGVVSGL